MSKATAIFADFIVAGASIRAENGELVIDAEEGKVAQDMLRNLADHKAEVLLMIEQDRGVSWEEWKAAMLNRLFLEQGTSGEPGRDHGGNSQAWREGTSRGKPANAGIISLMTASLLSLVLGDIARWNRGPEAKPLVGFFVGVVGLVVGKSRQPDIRSAEKSASYTAFVGFVGFYRG